MSSLKPGVGFKENSYMFSSSTKLKKYKTATISAHIPTAYTRCANAQGMYN
jgi:hypothetical protein